MTFEQVERDRAPVRRRIEGTGSPRTGTRRLARPLEARHPVRAGGKDLVDERSSQPRIGELFLQHWPSVGRFDREIGECPFRVKGAPDATLVNNEARRGVRA